MRRGVAEPAAKRQSGTLMRTLKLTAFALLAASLVACSRDGGSSSEAPADAPASAPAAGAPSDAVKAAGFTWDAEHLDKWLADPRGFMPGTKMTFAGLKNPQDRVDLIAYLKVETGYKPAPGRETGSARHPGA